MKAAALQRLQRFDDARALLTQVLDKVPNQEETLLELGVLDLNQKKTKEAEDLFHKAYLAQPNNLRGLLGESRALPPGRPAGQIGADGGEWRRRKAPRTSICSVNWETREVSAGQQDKAIATFQGMLTKIAGSAPAG